ncbi:MULTISPECIES: response regulator transcription factor [Burkholderia]|uniref:Response regulator n=1 Tax=Burkholderia sola TaxID=2843302 RepID=A0ABV2C9G6_9BURK|nr:response regulator [Burkholderia sp. CpTa8-5]MBP0607726.1 response regulator transcription factor [Burkholderia sp. CpTa8-5]RQZ85918.1 DNA-binding response regulator [Burkholderia cenocepacia]RRA05568.1 DNA-binding response regulator [Burkholderia cenocepacia]
MTDMNGGTTDPVVFVVDDDSAVREAVETLLDSVGLHVVSFDSAHGFLAADLPDRPSCVVLDVRLKGHSGLAVQEHIVRNMRLPVILMTAHGDIPMSVQAMKAGAVDFLPKPFRGQDMIDAVTCALESDCKRRTSERSMAILRASYDTLTPRERTIMTMVANGLLNKQIAAELGLSEITVKLHRGQAMKKMKSPSIADFVLKAEALGLISRDERLAALA